MCAQVLGSLHKAMESAALLNRIVWEEVINKCKEESFRISMSFRLAHKATGALLGGSQENSETAESSGLTFAGPKQQPRAAYPAMEASQGSEAAPVCIVDKGLEGVHPVQNCCAKALSGDMTALQDKLLLGPDAVLGGLVDVSCARHTELQGSTSGAAAITEKVPPSLTMSACARQPSNPRTCSTSGVDAAKLGSAALSGLGTAFRAHEARCRAAADIASAVDLRSPSAAEELGTPQPGASSFCEPQAGIAAASTSGNRNAEDGSCTPQPGTLDVLVVPALGHTSVANGLHAPQPGAAPCEGGIAGDSPPPLQGNDPITLAMECTGGESTVKGVFASKQSLLGASDPTPCRCDTVLCSHPCLHVAL